MYENYGNMLLQMKIQTHMVVHTSAFGVIHVAVLRPRWGSHNLRPSHVRYFLRREQRRQRRPLVAETRVIARNSPQGQRVSVNRLLVLVMAVGKRWRSVEPRVGGSGGGGVVPRRIRHWRCGSGTEAVVHEVVDMVRVGERASVHHRGLKVRAFGVLAFAFVRVLVAAEGLRGGEVSAAVVALEPATAFAVVISNSGSGGSSSSSSIVLVGIKFERVKVVVVGGGVGGCFCRVRVLRRDSRVVSAGEVYAKESNGWLLLDKRGRADEGELGEGVHVHEVVEFSLRVCWCGCCLVHKRETKVEGGLKGVLI